MGRHPRPRRQRTRPSKPKEAPDPGQAYDAAVRLLGLRAHSAVELGRKLGRRGFDADTVGSVLARLTEQGYLDDSEFARQLVSHRSRGRGGAAIAAELASRGVGRSVAQAAVAALDPEIEIAAAATFARRWLPRAEPGSLRSLLEIAGPRLARRGYGPGVVREACRRALGC
ncbi:MAG: RecX family transcriptional regulator [Candidatus Dormibacteraeota bacterium]|nr:RecX family transcriptional regulator [Candidatus Dormibacteraeota bacterium]